MKVIPSQSANSWLSNQLITFFNDPAFNPTGVEADALAIAPYFAGSVANDIVANNEVNTITVAEIVARMQVSIASAKEDIADNLAVAEANNLDLITYEGGQHLVGSGGNENITALTQKLMAANHHPDLEQVYCEYLDYWYQEIGQLFTHFSSHGSFSKWGSWGLKETMADVDNPKYLAMQNCVFDNNTVSIHELRRSAPAVTAYPNPSFDGRFTLTHMPEGKWICVDIAGKKVNPKVEKNSADKWQITLPQAGVYFFWSGSSVLKLIVL